MDDDARYSVMICSRARGNDPEPFAMVLDDAVASQLRYGTVTARAEAS